MYVFSCQSTTTALEDYIKNFIVDRMKSLDFGILCDKNTALSTNSNAENCASSLCENSTSLLANGDSQNCASSTCENNTSSSNACSIQNCADSDCGGKTDEITTLALIGHRLSGYIDNLPARHRKHITSFVASQTVNWISHIFR